MKFESFRDTLFSIALKKGCTAAETYFAQGDQFSADVLEQELNRYSVSNLFGLGLRVQLDGKDGYAYTEALENPEALVDAAMDNARAIDSSDEHPMQGKCEYRTVNAQKNPLSALSEHERIALALELETLTKAEDARVDRVSACEIGTEKSIIRIDNTLGLSAKKERDFGYCVVAPILVENGEMKDAYRFKIGSRSDCIKECAKEAVEDAAWQFGSEPVPSGEYKIVLHSEAARSLLSAFTGMFSAEMSQKGLSLLTGKEGEKIASELISIMDDPFEAEFPSAFDGEGTPTEQKLVVENGVFKTLLHNLKTAKKAGVRSTGNASRPSPASPVGVAPTNLYILPGKKSYEELVSTLQNGLVITSVSGLHAGVNPVSGSFSLLAGGKLIRDGKMVQAVDRITIAGTFPGILQDVVEVGSDLEFGLPGNGRIGSPSLLVDHIMVSGK